MSIENNINDPNSISADISNSLLFKLNNEDQIICDEESKDNKKNHLKNETVFESSVRLSIISNDIINNSNVRSSISIKRDGNSRASSYYEESESHIPISYFMNIWNKLINQNLDNEKMKAKEMIKQYSDNYKNTSCSCIPSSYGRSNTRNIEKNYQLEEEQILILALSLSPYCEANNIHWEILSSVYKCCNFNENDSKRKGVPRYGRHWEDIGFQSLDPATDFRGSGIFGLCQLLFLTSSGLSESVKDDILRLSQDKVYNFPFAVVGLNFTKMIIDRLRTGKLDKLAEKEKTYISVVNGIYRGIWIMFYRMWKSRKCQISDFSNILEELKKIIKSRPKYLLNMAIL
ncbi:Engulfment/cell motility, ELMO domain-containing protein [Strongyloides ratti]|uniref:Engulfment/cell motility, ELMO domain-containing protein n=1 Tax=Strongyloides ratti TaxID=34506 RepID=A0A090L9F0_STRRB|nr:Engulfment/cell motility, ELMO domain-containing protein [Strongyloides ratti]CEF66416.1 Engulfment/cell motility, ELMO domain-containing protein [Strongyloides ratti]